MTTEEKARAYDEALEDMRVIYPNLKGDAKLAVEHAFPELAESEDEFLKTMNLVYKAIRKTLASLAVYAEDEELLDSREDTLSYYSQRCAEEILKSLRPSWKPSEEQMKALHRCIYYLHGEGSEYFEPIKSLYEQLKKLI